MYPDITNWRKMDGKYRPCHTPCFTFTDSQKGHSLLLLDRSLDVRVGRERAAPAENIRLS
jgi:hypothetical protein